MKSIYACMGLIYLDSKRTVNYTSFFNCCTCMNFSLTVRAVSEIPGNLKRVMPDSNRNSRIE